MDASLTKNQSFESYAQQLNINPMEFTNVLWNQYHPADFWYVIFAIGMASAFSLFLYDRFVVGEKALK